ncbi:hypothetical protein D3C85_1536140 [compost metagenome]
MRGKALGDANWRHGIGHEQVADIRQLRTLGILVAWPHDACVDKQQVKSLALQTLLEGIKLARAVHFQGFHLHAWQGCQFAGLVRIADRSDNLPVIFQQTLYQSQSEAT